VISVKIRSGTEIHCAVIVWIAHPARFNGRLLCQVLGGLDAAEPVAVPPVQIPYDRFANDTDSDKDARDYGPLVERFDKPLNGGLVHHCEYLSR
jgi:hypothetical protein